MPAVRRATAGTALALAALVAVTGCGSSDDKASTGSVSSGGSGGASSAGYKIAFLMPDIASTRYELYDKPLFVAKVKELCPKCEVLYQNAQADASKQQEQANWSSRRA